MPEAWPLQHPLLCSLLCSFQAPAACAGGLKGALNSKERIPAILSEHCSHGHVINVWVLVPVNENLLWTILVTKQAKALERGYRISVIPVALCKVRLAQPCAIL